MTNSPDAPSKREAPATGQPDYVKGGRTERLLYYCFMALMAAGLVAILVLAYAA